MAIATGTLMVNKEDRFTLSQFDNLRQSLIDRITETSDIREVRVVSPTSFEIDLNFIIESV